MRRRSWTFLVGVALITPAVGWWLLANPDYPPFSSDSPAGIVRFAHFGSHEDDELWRSVIHRLEELHPDVRVAQEYVVGSGQQRENKLRKRLRSRAVPDVLLVPHSLFRSQAEQFANLGEVCGFSSTAENSFVSQLNPTGRTLFGGEGAQHGLPVYGGDLVIYGNPDCFEKAERFRRTRIPRPGDEWTLEEFRFIAERLTCDLDGDEHIDQFGFRFPEWDDYLPFLWSFGAEVTDEEATEWRLQGPAAEQAMQFYRDLLVGKRRVSPRDEEVSRVSPSVGFLTGRTAMCVNGPWFQPILDNTALRGRYYIWPMPRGPAGRFTRITWEALVIPKGLEAGREESACRFVELVLSKPIQQHLASLGSALPARLDSAEAFVGPDDTDRRSVFVKELSHSRVQPLPIQWVAFDRAVQKHLVRLTGSSGEVRMHEFLDEVAKDPMLKSSLEKRLSQP
jgi:multiple sugar transport system substrate-binding protein